jgi:hypothetical protein
MSWIRILIRIPIKIQKQDPDPDPVRLFVKEKVQEVQSRKRSIGGPQTHTMEAQRLKMVADSHHFNEELNPDPHPTSKAGSGSRSGPALRQRKSSRGAEP